MKNYSYAEALARVQEKQRKKYLVSKLIPRQKPQDARRLIKKKKTIKGIAKPKFKSFRRLNYLVWEECKRLNRKYQPNVCYTCGATNLEGMNWQCGHGKPKGALPLKGKYDRRNLKSQCMRCNVDFGGCTDIFVSKLEKEKEGLEFLKEFCYRDDDRWRINQAYPKLGGIDAKIYLTNLLEEYKKL